MSTIVSGITLSSDDSFVIRSWVRDEGLRDVYGRPLTLRKACEVILVSCADDLRRGGFG